MSSIIILKFVFIKIENDNNYEFDTTAYFNYFRKMF